MEVERRTKDCDYLPNGLVRASDNERLEIQKMLDSAYADGRLSQDQLKSRIDHLHALESRQDLNTVVRDLPAPAPAPVKEAIYSYDKDKYESYRDGAYTLGLLVIVILTVCCWIPAMLMGNAVWTSLLCLLPIMGTAVGVGSIVSTIGHWSLD